jgi:hypothetical protein
MIDYKKYIQVLEILRDMDMRTTEDKASAICELFDQKPAQSIGWFWYVKPMTLWDHLNNAPTPPISNFWKVTCGCTDKKDCEWYN